jgi:hypothetical protein
MNASGQSELVDNSQHGDHTEITRRVYEYALGIDTRDWVLYRSIFTPQVAIDFSSWNGVSAATQSADDWVASVSVMFEQLDVTQHTMTNPIVDIEGDRARCRMYMQAEHFLQNDQGEPDFTIGGYYDNQFVRVDSGWRISAVRLNVLWSRGNRHIMTLALEAGRLIKA